jgi:diketogulonate reductase-like aldo/keto reductase
VGAGLATAALARAGADAPKGPLPGSPKPGQIKLPPGAVMPTRPLGRTGEKISLLALGGYHLGLPRDDEEATRIVRGAIDHGVTFFDNCWDYHRGRSEERLGNALKEGYRRKVMVMTKLDGRTRAAASQQLEQSLRRLQTDVIDVVQIHEVIRMDDADRVFAPGGAIEALIEARKAGKLRFIGFTGHKDPAIHLHMLDTAFKHGFTFDTVQMPLNVMDPHYRSFQKNVLPVLTAHSIGVLGMKPLASGILLESGVASPLECLHYPMSLPASTVITGCDGVGVLEQGLYAAYTWQPPAPAEVAALLGRSAGAGATGRYEPFKNSDRFDGTARHPEWLEVTQP